MLLRFPRPLHGWRAFWGEVGVIVLGVLIALGAQQVVEAIDWRGKADAATTALRQELGSSYGYAIEMVMVAPCVDRQLDILGKGLRAPVRVPAATFAEPGMRRFVYRAPSREWPDQVWRGTVENGVASHLDPDFAKLLAEHYAAAALTRDQTAQMDRLGWRLNLLAQADVIDPATRGALMLDLESARGMANSLALISNQIARRLIDAGLIDPKVPLKAYLPRSGTLDFCRAQGLPIGAFDPHGPMS